MDFEVQRCTRQCAVTGRPFEPGATIYTVLSVEGAEVVRNDYSAEAWKGPPEGALGWWKSQTPEKNAKRLHWAPNDVMLDMFERLEDEPDQRDMRFVLALLLARRRVLRLEDSRREPDGRESMELYCPRNEKSYQVETQFPTEQRTEAIQEELAMLLTSAAG